MFGRVRPSDLVLAATAVTGVIAGLVLMVAARIGVTGSALIGVGIVAAMAAAVRGVRAQVSAVVNRDRQQRDRLDAVLAVPIRALGEVDPFTIGVFPSAFAEAAQHDWPTAPTEGTAVPPYVRRDVDEALRRALKESSLARAGRLVVLRGDPKAGKSRSLWEAIRVLPDRRLLAVIQPDPAADKLEPAAAPLATLAALDRPVSRCKGRDLVIWVDDAQAHLWRGLTRDTLRRLAARYPAAVIALTMHSSGLDALRDIDRPLHDLLRRPFDDLLLRPRLSPAELDDARAAYPALADNDDLVRLPELFAAVDLLTDRYRHHGADEPVGVAVAKAVIDWQRAGMLPGSIDEPTLRALAELVLADIAPNQILDDDAFTRGLAWATREVAAFAALVRRQHVRGSTARRFRAFDAVVSWAQEHDPPIGQDTWDFVLEHASDLDLLDVGVAATMAAAFEVAFRAFEGAIDAADSSVVAPALQYMGVLLWQMDRKEEAITVCDQLIERFSDSVEPKIAKRVAVALVNKGWLLEEVGREGDAMTAYDQVVERFGDTADDPWVARSVAKALCTRSVMQQKLGRPDEAATGFDQVIKRFGDSDDPLIAEAVGIAFYNKGEALQEAGLPNDAVTAYDQAIKRFSGSDDPHVTRKLALSLARKGHVLNDMGRLDDAVTAFGELIERFGDSQDLMIAKEVAVTLVDKAHALGHGLGRPDDAVIAFDQAIERFGDSADPLIAGRVAAALLGKAVTLWLMGRLDDAVTVYDQVVERFGDSDDQQITLKVAAALAGKGVALSDLGKVSEAVTAFDNIVEQFGGSADPEVAYFVAKALARRDAIISRSEGSKR